jgi:ketosteroid isomerase-like protein
VSANLDLVRSIFAAWERGDFGGADWADPGIEYLHHAGPLSGSWTGLRGMAEGERDFLSAYAGLRVTVEQYRELDDERVLALAHASGRAKMSGLDLDQVESSQHAALLFHLRGGKVTRLVMYFDRQHAFADLGLEE